MTNKYQYLVTTLLLAIFLMLGETLYIIIDLLLESSALNDSFDTGRVDSIVKRRDDGEEGFASALPVFQRRIEEMIAHE